MDEQSDERRIAEAVFRQMMTGGSPKYLYKNMVAGMCTERAKREGIPDPQQFGLNAAHLVYEFLEEAGFVRTPSPVTNPRLPTDKELQWKSPEMRAQVERIRSLQNG